MNMHDVILAVLWIAGAAVVGGVAKWVGWSAKQGVGQLIGPAVQELREHMATEEARAAVNDEQHAEFRRRITRLENR